MTHRSITTVLGSLLFALLITVNAPAVSACGLDSAGNYVQASAMVTRAVPGLNPAADATQQYQQEMDAAAQAANLLATRPFTAPTLSAMSERACTHPSVGFPTCYTLQADGMWAREDLPDRDSAWVMVGLVTFDEVVAAVGDVNAIAP